ncbi:MAG TPA: type II toxin-antitoxin system VapC family toxin [Candidatus Methylomirabilis sp.]|nr:type II toxin-antitoxin system VapC family toxin [Candidatus Methylomirabilis sp.]
MGPYLDTSALAKWYLNEPFSEKFETFIQEQSAAVISRLTIVEFRCLLARRRRAGEISKSVETRSFAAFEEDVRAGFLQVHPVVDEHLIAALGLITRLARFPLRALDAMHLAIVQSIHARRLATADRVMANAGKAIGLEIVRFF